MNGISAETLFLCLMCGVLLGLLFSVFELVRCLFTFGKCITAVSDVFFCLLAAAATFLLSLAISAGYPRFFQLAFEALGFLCVQVTLTHGICRFVPRRIKAFRRRAAKKAVSKTGSIAKKRKKRALFPNKSKKSEKKT